MQLDPRQYVVIVCKSHGAAPVVIVVVGVDAVLTFQVNCLDQTRELPKRRLGVTEVWEPLFPLNLQTKSQIFMKQGC